MTNLRELWPTTPSPEASNIGSSVGVASPGKMPLLSPKPPAISEAESKLTHLRTPGCAHRVVKFWLPGGGVTGGGGGGGGGGGAALAALASPTCCAAPPQPANAKATRGTNSRVFMRDIGILFA